MNVEIVQDGDEFRLRDRDGDYLQASSVTGSSIIFGDNRATAMIRHNDAAIRKVAKDFNLRVVSKF